MISPFPQKGNASDASIPIYYIRAPLIVIKIFEKFSICKLLIANRVRKKA